jgi:hypothetical protein
MLLWSQRLDDLCAQDANARNPQQPGTLLAIINQGV